LSDFDYDFFVIGGGSGGVRASRIAAALGAKVGLAEERYLGGTCVNVGCIPKKLLSYAAHYSKDFNDSMAYGWEFDRPPIHNWKTLITNKDAEILRLNGIYQSLLINSGVDIFQQRASIQGKHTICLANRTVTARHILIATGGWPFIPDIPGKELAITSNEAFALDHLPASILIVGGGYIAIEFAGILAALGVETELCYRGKSLLRGFDSDLCEHFTKEINKYCRVHPQTSVTRLESVNGKIRAQLDTGKHIDTNLVLFATGRKPNTARLGLESTGVALDAKGAIIVDSEFRTNVASIYALGDVIDRLALTPVALAEGQLLAQRLFDDSTKTMSYENIPTAIFSQPNIATVGHTEAQARSICKNLLVFKSRFTPLRHTLTGNSEKTFLKMLVDKDTDRVLGIHMMGSEAGEIIQGLAVAMNAGATKAHFDMTLGIHPTTAEEFVTMRTPEPQ
jgi:glutathione reductase (NADPH)